MINVKTTERNGKVVGIMQVEEDSECMIISQYGKIIRLPNSQMAPDGGSACADIRWYCRDVRACTGRWPSARRPAGS